MLFWLKVKKGGPPGHLQAAGAGCSTGNRRARQTLGEETDVLVIAAGGIMDGAGIAAAVMLGAVAAQLGTAFIDCTDSAADAGYRWALRGLSAEQTSRREVQELLN
jgi:nitronate monooxygenase